MGGAGNAVRFLLHCCSCLFFRVHIFMITILPDCSHVYRGKVDRSSQSSQWCAGSCERTCTAGGMYMGTWVLVEY